MNIVKAIAKRVRMSPIKVRQVTRLIQGRNAEEALEYLRYIPRKSARLVAKVLQSAIANATNNHNLSAEDLVILEATANQGPVIKRFMPAARGSAHPIRKGSTHIEIKLSSSTK